MPGDSGCASLGALSQSPSRAVSTEPLPSHPACVSGRIQRQPDPGSPTHTPPASSQLQLQDLGSLTLAARGMGGGLVEGGTEGCRVHLVQGAEVCRRCCGCAVFAVGWKCDCDGEKEGTGSWLGQSRAGMQEPGYHQGLQGTPVPPRTQALISPHVCLAETAWGSRGGRLRELDSLLVPVPLLTLSPLAGRGLQRGQRAHGVACS